MGVTFNSESYFREPLLTEYGFREYDARWVIEPIAGRDGSGSQVELNYRGLTLLGNALGSFLAQPENGGHTKIVVGHDFRRYAENAKNALTIGLLASGLDVHDCGMCLTPSLYAAQYFYEVPACAMLTGSHNPNGWTGVKMGYDYSKTFGPDRMAAFKALAQGFGNEMRPAQTAGRYAQIHDATERYLQDLFESWSPRLSGADRLRVAVETGNGTGGAFLPELLDRLGFDVVRGHVGLDWEFPHFNPNPEAMPFLRAVQELVTSNGCDVGVCLDGDGDRVGVIDDRGRVVFSDRMGLAIAKRMERDRGAGRFVADVKSTSLFVSELESELVWAKTGHSYVKAAVAESEAIAGFERSGHFFFREPYGRGYDDGPAAALAVLWLACEARADGRKLSDVMDELPPSHQSPNRQPKVPEAKKYEIEAEIAKRLLAAIERDGGFAGKKLEGPPMKINGIRLHFEDRSWLLVRASSNTPNLVVIAESFDEDGSRIEEIDTALRALIADMDDVGDFEPLHEIG